MSLNKKALTELAKSFARFIYFGVLGLIVTFLTSLVAGGTLNDTVVTVAGQSFNVGFLILAGITGLIKLLDRYRKYDPNTDSKGLAPGFLQK